MGYALGGLAVSGRAGSWCARGGERLEELAVLRGLTEVDQVRIFLEVGEVGVASLHGSLQRLNGLIDSFEERVAAREVVPRQGVVVPQLRHPQIYLEPFFVEATPRVRLAQGHERIHEVGIGAEEPLVKGNFKLEEFF